MQIKSKLLIAGAIIALIALTTMQGYLTFNTYDLRKKSFAVESRTKIGSIVSTPYVDSLSWAYRMEFIEKVPDFKNGAISKEELLKDLENAAKAKNEQFRDYFKRGAKHFKLDDHILFKKVASGILFTDENGATQEILVDGKDDPVFLLGEDFPLEEGLIINAWNWTFDKGYINENGLNSTVNIKYRASIYMKIVDWDKIIFKQLLILFLIAFLLFVFVITLVTYSIRNLLKLKRISDIKTDFINNITHELKTPLATLSIATKTLTNKFAKDNTDISQESIDTINRQNKRLQNLIDQVVDNSLGYNDIDLKLEPVNLTTFINEVCDDYALTLPRHIQFLRAIDKTSVEAYVDKFYLSTAIVNILNNAIKFDGTVIKVSYQIKNQMHIISITDNGIGISKKNKSLIFGKFFRVSERNEHNYKGLGLGLYYCNQIIKAHRGTIDVESKEKEGSTFYLKIPLDNGKADFTGR
ncbi:HAMP domain-containing histidine kinase [Subsaxibacter sp. CAU 1640]|uniref:sensor histidine kinase n=1 Tax=Subsaxibacter sp. CAU 1640 TaxID=2933271 RepID=UPI002006BE92|nr:HAMP domain-containing sensor histidine kinase [Subsaxibacter sp. CAU 1640]MCK7590373.1 HAMP domain-containing histidine kinase [Subsaxibacter sp. CAU 1640]